MKNNTLFVLAFLFLKVASAAADVTLPAIFSDHAVLQKAKAVPIWGKAAPDEVVTVTFDGTKVEGKADAAGKWQVILDLSGKADGPFQLLVEGKNKITVNDVVVGDVWVCSGQSNMEFSLRQDASAATELPKSANLLFRNFAFKKNATMEPTDKMEGSWLVASPESSGFFTAVGYYFGKMLNANLHRPIGLIHTSWGGTPVESWTSSEALDKDPELKAAKDKTRAAVDAFPAQFEEYKNKYTAWAAKYSRQDRPTADVKSFAAPDALATDWKPVKLPGLLSAGGLPGSGAVWIRKKITVPPAGEGQTLRLDLALINGFETIYWQGEKVAETLPSTPGAANKRQVYIGNKLVHAGEGTIAIRVFNPTDGMGVTLPPNTVFKAGSIELGGEWLAKTEFELPPLDAAAKAEYPQPPPKPTESHYVPAALYNAMIYPLLPYAIIGSIWYQGEANAGRAFQYRRSFPLMIQDWRARWNQGDFPFYFCQLANYQPVKEMPEESAWAELREAQTMTLSLPNTGMAVLIDLGEEGDIHPKNKKDVGERLAKAALAKTYGQTIPYSGPRYQSMSVEGDKVRLTFQFTDGGLVAKALPATYVVNFATKQSKPLVKPVPASELQGFAICGEDKVWKWADAKIDKDTVVVSAAGVAKPVAVRYAWANSPICNLYNAADLPAIPFRTDDFAMMTGPK